MPHPLSSPQSAAADKLRVAATRSQVVLLIRAVRERGGSFDFVPGKRAAVDGAFERLEQHD